MTLHVPSEKNLAVLTKKFDTTSLLDIEVIGMNYRCEKFTCSAVMILIVFLK